VVVQRELLGEPDRELLDRLLTTNEVNHAWQGGTLPVAAAVSGNVRYARSWMVTTPTDRPVGGSTKFVPWKTSERPANSVTGRHSVLAPALCKADARNW